MITGAGRGTGVDFARAAQAAGHAVVATGRNPSAVARALGASDASHASDATDDLLVVKLDITKPAEARALVTLASEAQPPGRFLASADAIATAEQKIDELAAQIAAWRELSTSLAFDA